MLKQLDLEAAKKAVAERIASRLPHPRDRCLALLRDVLDAELSVYDFVSYALAVCEKHAFCAESIASISVSEVLGGGATKSRTRATRSRARSKDTEVAVSALEAVLSSAKDYLPRTEIFKTVLAANAGLTEAQVTTAWGIARPTLQTTGKGPMVRFKKA